MIPVSYNFRNLTVRKSTTLAAAVGLGLVVFVFASALMLANGLEKALTRAGRDDIAIVLRKGSETELSSGLDTSAVNLIMASQEIAKQPDGQSVAVAEIVIVATMSRADGRGVSNVQIRGVPGNAAAFRPEVKIIEGRAPQPGTTEVMIGKSLRGRVAGMALGKSFDLRSNRPMAVVGVFSAEGSALESEVWADLHSVGAAFGRGSSVSSVRVKLVSPGMLDRFKSALASDPRLDIDVFGEREYYQLQSVNTSILIKSLGIMVAVFFSVGAMIGAMITMHSTVANRKREIGTLRALGFSRASILMSFLLESMLLALVGGALGAVAALPMRFVEFSTVNFATWSEVVFKFEPTPGILVGAMFFAAAMGFLGGFLPAVRAARTNPIEAMRD